MSAGKNYEISGYGVLLLVECGPWLKMAAYSWGPISTRYGLRRWTLWVEPALRLEARLLVLSQERLLRLGFGPAVLEIAL